MGEYSGPLGIAQNADGTFVIVDTTILDPQQTGAKLIVSTDFNSFALSGLVNFTADTVVGALNELKAGGVGTIAIDSASVTNALGYIPYDAANPTKYITGITADDVNAVGDITNNTSGQAEKVSHKLVIGTNLTGSVSSYDGSQQVEISLTNNDVINAIGFYPYNENVNPAGYISEITSKMVNDLTGLTISTSGQSGTTLSIAGHKVSDLVNDSNYLVLATLPIATSLVKGIASVDGVTVFANDGVLSSAQYTLPIATTSSLGGVKVDGTTITISNGVIHGYAGYTLPVATSGILGGIKVGANLTIQPDGTLSAPTPYSLPTASTSTLGGVKVDGTTVYISSGVISSTNLLALNKDIIPDTASVRNLGSATKPFSNIYADEVHVGASSLYVDGIQVLTSTEPTMKFKSDIDQGILIQTNSSIQGTGNGNVILESQNLVQAVALGGVSFTIPSTLAAKDIVFSNASTGGMIRFSGTSAFTGDVAISGNLSVSGTMTTVNTTQVNIADNLIQINSNQTGTPPSILIGGIAVNRGDSPAYEFVYVEADQNFQVGQINQLQPVATRESAPIANAVPYWDATNHRFGTGNNLSFNPTTGALSATSFVGTIASSLTGHGVSELTNDTGYLTGITAAMVNGVGNITNQAGSVGHALTIGANLTGSVATFNGSASVTISLTAANVVSALGATAVQNATNATNVSGGVVTGTNMRIPTSQPANLANGDIWIA